MMTDLTFRIAGRAGQGLQSISTTLGRLLTRAGYHVFVNQDLMSRIRGGNNYSSIRVSDTPVSAPAESVNVLIALDEGSLNLHLPNLVPGGVAMFDADDLGAVTLPAGSSAVLFPGADDPARQERRQESGDAQRRRARC